jgi:hypothetical protein
MSFCGVLIVWKENGGNRFRRESVGKKVRETGELSKLMSPKEKGY